LAEVVEEITKVDQEALVQTIGYDPSVAKRMSWAANRETSRPEDRAYSLLGLFGINMPTLYGEGSRAFIRLQEEIMKVSNDQSIFAWQHRSDSQKRTLLEYGSPGVQISLLAASPNRFENSSRVRPADYEKFEAEFYVSEKASAIKLSARPDYAMTNFGVRIRLPLQKSNMGLCYAYLACSRGLGPGCMRILLQRKSNKPPGHYARVNTSLEFPMTIDLQSVTIEDIYITDGDHSLLSTPKLGYYWRILVAIMQVPSSSQFKFVDRYPPDRYLLENSPLQLQKPIRLREPIKILCGNDNYSVLSFQDPSTGWRFSAVFGIFDERMWSDIVILAQNETAEMIYRDYSDSTGLRRSRCKHCDWVKKRLAGDTGNVLLTAREMEDRKIAVKITVTKDPGKDSGSIAYREHKSLPPPKSLTERRDRERV
jgi:hypothetical protein